MEGLRSKRGWLVGLIVALALVMGLMLAGCGPSDEEKVKTAVDDEMSLITNPTDEMIQQLADEASSGAAGSLETMGIDSTEMVKSWIDGFSYEIGEVSVDGDTATVDMTITCKQFGPVVTAWTDDLQTAASSGNFTSIDEVYSYAGQSLMDGLNNASPVTTEVTLDVEKGDGGDWSLPQNSNNQTAIMDAMIGALD